MKKQDQMKGRSVEKAKEDRDEVVGANRLAETRRCGLDFISKEIRDLRADMKKDMNSLTDQITEDARKEINK